MLGAFVVVYLIIIQTTKEGPNLLYEIYNAYIEFRKLYRMEWRRKIKSLLQTKMIKKWN